MKVEGGGGGVATSSAATVLHKIKVKEETKDCCTSAVQSSTATSLSSLLSSSAPATSSASPSSPAAGASRGGSGLQAIGAVATITISSGCTGEIAAAAAVISKQGGCSIGAATMTPTPTMTTAATAAGTTAVNSDVFPVDLDLKSRAKGLTRDKVPSRDDVNGTESRGSSSSSPSLSPGSHYQPQPQSQPQSQPHHLKLQSQQQPRATSSSSGRSPDSADDQGPSGILQCLKTEAGTSDEVAPHRLHQDSETAKCGGGEQTNGSGVNRCISEMFAAHGKLKRLLGTLVQFAMDISPDTGDTVRTLVLGLLSGSMSSEEFHSALQEATNFPLRGFVLPYLKHTLPSLQRDLAAVARADNQTCAQYLRANEHVVLESVGLAASTGESVDLFGEHVLGHSAAATGRGLQYTGIRPGGGTSTTTTTAVASTVAAMHAAVVSGSHVGYGSGHASKRRASDTLYYENGAGAFEDGPPYAKRPTNPWAPHHHHQAPHQHHHHQPHQQPHHLSHHHHHPHQQQQQQHHPPDVPYCWYAHPLHSSSSSAVPIPHHPHGPSGSSGGGGREASLIPNLVQIGACGGQPGYPPPPPPQASISQQQQQQQQQQQHLPHQPAVAHGSGPGAPGGAAPTQNGPASLDDEWKNIHVMLNCILGMVEKTKRALAILQRRGCASPAAAVAAAAAAAAAAASAPGLQTSLSNGGQQTATIGNGTQSQQQQQQQQLDGPGSDREGTFKRLSGEIVAQTIRATEDRVAEVKRRAEEAVQEVKRAAVAEVQRAVAVAVAESRASERLRSQRYLDSLPRSGPHGPLQQQQQQQQQQHGRPSPFLRVPEATARATGGGGGASTTGSTTSANDDDKETHITSAIGTSCWNCGRPALETCGGCGIARYCGSFCQHRDWEAGGHHATCSSTSSSNNNKSSNNNSSSTGHKQHERARSATPSPSRTTTGNEPDASAIKTGSAAVSAVVSSGSARVTK